MRKITKGLLGLFVISVLSFTSCVSSKKFKALESAKMSVDSALSAAQSTISNLESEKGVLMGDKSSLESQVMQIKSDLEGVKGEIAGFKTKISAAEKTISDKESQLTNIRGQIAGAFKDINSSGLSVFQRGDMFYVSMSEKLVFSSGSANVSSSGRTALQNLSSVLAKNPSMKVLVEGHTDSRQLNSGASYNSNWDLSVARAVSVVKQLVKNGMPAGNLIAAGRGEHVPAVTEIKGDKNSYQQNRRVEIALIPSVSSLYNLR